VASGLDNNSHAEPMQRLSDLEWLIHKQENKSVIDDLFTGQLVEAQHCLSCNRISVGIQTFNILPVPIVEPREVSGVVYLMDCFSKFGNMENLFDSDGLQCPCSNKNIDTPVCINTPGLTTNTAALSAKATNQQKGPTTHVGRLLSRDSAVGSPVTSSHLMFGQSTLMSPIPSSTAEVLNDSGFQDNQYKTSTPILHDRTHSTDIKPSNLTNGQRRSLLRQLPECLIVQLLRFRYNSSMHDLCKIHTPVNIPLKNLDLNSVVFDTVVKREDLTTPPEAYEYDLYGVCLHLGAGATNCGHYISYCMVSDGTWWKFDDEEVTQVNMEFELNSRLVRENAYMLFYKRKIVS
jgi:ubiquitin carboxyl-terminal hydrolase 8